MFCVGFSDLSGFLDSRSCTWKKNSEHSQDDHQVPYLAIRGAPAYDGTQACCLGPMLRYMLIGHFFHGEYSVAIPDSGVVYYMRAWDRCDQV